MIAAARVKSTPLIFLGLIALAVAGCGGAEPTQGNGPRGVFTSTSDCAAHDKFDFKSCSEAVRAAIKIHNEKSPTYESLRICKASEAACERTVNNDYRPRLLGFFVQLPENEKKGEELVGKPLYAVKSKRPKNMSFADHNKQEYADEDVTLVFSQRAIAVYQENAKSKKSRRFGS